ncbi:MAG: PKD domain-containing protein, partial [Microthrixaceae bacterium]|nr:PKD domain-containing protein [Microthrixaceae bacterium]
MRSATSALSRRLRRRRHRDQRGITLLETIIAMVITSTILLPSMGFISLAMTEQVTARTLTQETSNIAAADVALLRDVTNSKAAVGSLGRAPGDIRDCSGGPGAGGEVALALIDSKNYRVVYSLEPVGANPRLGRTLWRRVCPNQSGASDATLADPTQLNSPDATPTEGFRLAERIGSAFGSCPADALGLNPTGQDVDCRQVKLSLTSIDTGRSNVTRPPVVLQATRRTDSYAVPSAPPIPRFTYTPLFVEDGDAVAFDASGSRDRRGGPLEYKWSFGAPVNHTDTAFSSSLVNTTHNIPFRAVGTTPAPLTVVLTVRNSEGVEASTPPLDIDLNAKRPTASLQPSPPIVTIRNRPFQFTPNLQTYSNATIASATWDWGDGSTDVACNPGGTSCTTPKSHTFTELGNKFVKVTVVDSNGAEASAQVSIRVDTDIVYVRSDGTDNATCGIISSPCRQINYGMSRAISLDKPKVYVAGGTYSRFTMRTDVEVEGGWNNNFTAVSGTASTVTGSTASVPYGIFASGVTNAKAKGFTVQTPTVTSGSTQGILIGNGTGTASTVTLENIIVSGGTGNHGTGMVVQNGSNVTAIGLNVTSPTALGTGSSVYGVRVIGQSASVKSQLTSTNSSYRALAGNNGADGSNTPPDPPPPACNGNSVSSCRLGGASCGHNSGKGGDGNFASWNRGYDGNNGGNSGGNGGSGGGNNCGWFGCSDAYSGNGGNGSPNTGATAGSTGAGGANTPASS